MIELLKVYSGSYFRGALGGGWRWGEGVGRREVRVGAGRPSANSRQFGQGRSCGMVRDGQIWDIF